MRKFCIILLLLSPLLTKATHQVSGYITVKWISGTTYQITINDYTNICNTVADRDTLTIHWGDGTSDILSRNNGPDSNGFPHGVQICSCRKINLYTGTHTYPGDGVYRMWFDDPDRMYNIYNMSQSGTQDMYLFNTLIISPFTGDNISSPVVTNPVTCIFACGGECYYFNPGAYTTTGDSLSYVLGNSLTTNGQEAAGYFVPNPINPGGTVNLNPVTGTLSWCSPPNPTNAFDTTYNFVTLILEWKKFNFHGHVVSQVVDTLECEFEVILKGLCHNQPPVIAGPTDTCITEGTDLAMTYTISDADHDSFINVVASGEPFSTSPPATQSTSGTNPVTLKFDWKTGCAEVRRSPYQVTISATDNGYPVLNSYYSNNIFVVAPAPTGLCATPIGNTVYLHWHPSICPQVSGYCIYRHTGCEKWRPANCETGVPSYTGYTLLGCTTGINDTTFTDDNGGSGLSTGAYYDYMVVADFPQPDGSVSYASLDTCVLIKHEVPVLTNVSVNQTDPSHGKMFVRWQRPFAGPQGFDTTACLPPYKYVLNRATGIAGKNFTPLDSVKSTFFLSKIDTTYTDTGLNTLNTGYNYRVDFFCQTNKPAGFSPTASSIFLTVKPDNNKSHLSWVSNVPWNDSSFSIYRRDPPPAAPVFNFIAKIPGSQTTYLDSNLTNGKEYCYYVESRSAYFDTSVAHPLFDSSEVICDVPKDTVPPCNPTVNIYPKCLEQTDSLVWHYPYCVKNKDVPLEYKIYFSPLAGNDVTLIATITNIKDTVYVLNNLNSVAGCYAVTAVDSAMYESPIDTTCIDNCPEYRLPNVFTPNGSGKNDFFTPILPYRYVQDIDIDIFNRWGQIMFHTTDPKIMWNGTDRTSGKPCPDGAYYYVCIVHEMHVTGIKSITLTGFVQILR